ncbi:CHASE2 domain-containing protein [Ancylothrix sp. C2]|uniref:CHASE2 domain-containing protein n=1 Tax=Ancylothrix sp. D3o TaxID=2953691 RepID=UPI0021BB2C94|nr:CHASE2 domain-containing protein [Ancylothrix sp. D3o]MCT7952735.1 CHASE2 domain-containing protein [Ancylothrix sp. D3o]
MAKLVKLSLECRPDMSYQVQLVEIKEEGKNEATLVEGITGSLPAVTHLYEQYKIWREQYRQLGSVFQKLPGTQSENCPEKNREVDVFYRELRFRKEVINDKPVSLESCQKLALEIKTAINEWLDAPTFRKVEEVMRTNLSRVEEIRILVKTGDVSLWKLPWCEWDFFEDYPFAEVVFSPAEFGEFERPVITTPHKNVRILALCGDRTGIDYRKDQEDLKRLSLVGAEPAIIEEPSLQKVRELLWDKQWDILFFAGHSSSNGSLKTGDLYINSTEKLTPEEFKNSLKNARDKGLKIVLLNSCDGLGLAGQLVSELKIPLVIAMRERVPNIVAQKFLEYFLLEYAYRNKPLYVAVRKARERISEEFQKLFPCVDWLPVVFQNGGIQAPKWKDLHRKVSGKQAVLGGLAGGFLIVLMRLLGMLQPVELGAFDHFMRARPEETKDDRILVVTVSEADIQYQKDLYPDRQDSLSDQALSEVLTKVAEYEPIAVGLDFYRDRNLPPNLIKSINKLPKFVAICKWGHNLENPSIYPPYNLQKNSTVGFANIPLDENGFVRRQLLRMADDDICDTPMSFNIRMAMRYLENTKDNPSIKRESPNEIRIGQTSFRKLEADTGGYQLPNGQADGFQIMLNYRNADFEKISLREILQGRGDAKLRKFKNAIILIGSEIDNEDQHYTPYNKKMAGVILHAHMTSQIISAVLDNRPLLSSWSEWIERFWIIIWGLVGGLIVWKTSSPTQLIIATGSALTSLYGICFIFFLQAVWVPLVPSALALIFTGTALLIYGNPETQKQINNKLGKLLK